MLNLNPDTFTQQLQLLHWRIVQIFQESGTTPLPSNGSLIPTVYKELGLASEELQVAAEELLQQNDELATARGAVEMERQRYQDLFEFAPDAYLVTDSTGIIWEANRAACKLLNISPEYVLGKPLSIFVPESERQSFRKRFQQLHNFDSASEWITNLCPRQGEVFDAALTIAAVCDKQGNPFNLRICIRNITQRLRAKSILEKNDCDLSENRPRNLYSKGEGIPLNNNSIWLVVTGLVKLTTICENGEEIIVGLAGPQMPFGSSLTSLPNYQATALSKNV